MGTVGGGVQHLKEQEQHLKEQDQHLKERTQ